jgi:pyruvate kinase
VDVVRFNFSHGTHEEHRQRIELVKRVRQETGRTVAMLQDLCGPKIRTTPTPDNRLIALRPGDTFTLVSSKTVLGDPLKRVTGTTYERLAQEVAPGQQILLSDGLITLQVREVVGTRDIVCTVVHGGALKGSQGINVPASAMAVAAVTDKDVADLAFGLAHGFDWVAASFVRSAGDVLALRDAIARHASALPAGSAGPRVMAKIEKPQALDQLEAILGVVDGIMVARGDLGVEMLPHEVPIAQKRIVAAANRRGVPVVVATQMLESMIQAPRPTRAEVSDICNAIFDGTDACMLSGETAAGAFPVEAVEVMREVAAISRANPDVDTSISEQLLQAQRLPLAYVGGGGAALAQSHGRPTVAPPVTDASCAIPPQVPGLLASPEETADRLRAIQQASLGGSAAYLAKEINAAAIVTFTLSGRTALAIARHRPTVPIFAFTTSAEVARQVRQHLPTHPHTRMHMRAHTEPRRGVYTRAALSPGRGWRAAS